MNEAHLHVALNHFPVVGAIIATGILLSGLLRKNEGVQRTALWIFILLALIAIPVLISGEAAKELLEHAPGFDEELIERHEELATITFWMLILSGIVSMVRLFFMHGKKWQPVFTKLIALLAVAVSAMVGLTANTGGKIRHTEFEKTTIDSLQNIKAEENEEPGTETEKGRGRKRKGKNVKDLK